MVSTDKFNLLHSYIFRNNNVMTDNTFSYKDKSILYICQNGTSGYANAAKGYIYDYIGKKIPVKAQYFNCSDEVNENDRFHEYLNSCTSTDIDYNTIIVHSTPNIWTEVIKNAPNVNLEGKLVIGRTVWEFEKLLPAWVDSINTSIVDIVSVPTEWNKQCFIKNGVIKPIIVEPHVYVDYPHKKTGLKHLLTKSIMICKNENTIDIENNYKFYCIGQMIERKGIIETIDAFCNAFTCKDKVVLYVKTFKLNYSKEEQQKCLREIVKITDKYDHAPIIYIKDNLNYDEIKSLHDIGDCYFHLTKTEGFCLGAFDAFNNDKKIIITGYGGHIEYLGKDYDGIVNYSLKSLDKNESVFFQFKLDDTYKWAIADKKHANKLLNSAIFGKNLHGHISSKLQDSIFSQSDNIKIVDLPYTDKNFYLNSCIFKSYDKKLLLMTRESILIGFKKFKNTLKLYELDESYNVVKNLKLKIIDEIDDEQYEDPRVLVHDNKYYVGCANYQYNNIKFIHQKVLVFDKNFNHIDNIHIEYEGNGKTIEENTINQKNWTWFIHNNSLMMVYRMNPHVVLEIDLDTKKVVAEYKHFQDISEIWDFGECRMGSNPILKDGYYHNFFHSSLPWKHPKRQYFMGYYKFETVPPFKIVEISKEPILYGNEVDERVLQNISPLVIFPCGAIEKNGKFIVSFGLNDEKTGIIKI